MRNEVADFVEKLAAFHFEMLLILHFAFALSFAFGFLLLRRLCVRFCKNRRINGETLKKRVKAKWKWHNIIVNQFTFTMQNRKKHFWFLCDCCKVFLTKVTMWKRKTSHKKFICADEIIWIRPQFLQWNRLDLKWEDEWIVWNYQPKILKFWCDFFEKSFDATTQRVIVTQCNDAKSNNKNLQKNQKILSKVFQSDCKNWLSGVERSLRKLSVSIAWHFNKLWLQVAASATTFNFNCENKLYKEVMIYVS